MRRRSALTVFAVTVLLVLGPGRALAGGPTSVLLVAPGSGQTASLYAGDDDYELLGELLGAFGGTPPSADDSSGADHAAGNGVTVTWLVHDVQVWRVDYVFLAAPGGPWVATRVSDLQGGTIWDSEVAWHRVVDGALLENLLGRLDLVLGSSRVTVPQVAPAPGLDRVERGADPTVEDTRTPAGAAGARTPAGAAPRASSTSSWTAAAWAWGVAGIVLGVGAGVLVGRWRLPVVRTPDPLPHAASGSPAGPEPDNEDWVLDDELTSPGGRGGVR